MVRQVKDVQLGDHLCLAFTHEAEQREVASAFVAAGLTRGERVLYFADDPSGDRVHRWLRQAGVDVTAATASGQLDVRPAEEGYLAAGRFDPDVMIAALRGEVGDSLAAGFTGFRISGEMSWALRGTTGVERLEEYERRVTALFAEGMSAAICQYDSRLFPAERLGALTGCHPERVQMNALLQNGSLRVMPGFDAAGNQVLRVTGAIDSTTAPAWSAILQNATGGDGDVQVDMAGLEFIDVAGLRELVRVAAALPDGRRLHVLNLAPALDKVIRLVGWDRTAGLIVGTEVVPA
ncbi:MEDS domain-containing protein [Planomonospora sp. ID67723]|uniref:MEDS domain-containing protein n=1 Tax=Planomonospora sp. ID67723 TaxID=2738134 RepID=UPI0018C37728|nr:MEDS domain-containing protein [Planomonospora sp. ID67723]MBG0826648.1 MEDS domain-containing protein [Planomonospora sp. ID67723]